MHRNRKNAVFSLFSGGGSVTRQSRELCSCHRSGPRLGRVFSCAARQNSSLASTRCLPRPSATSGSVSVDAAVVAGREPPALEVLRRVRWNGSRRTQTAKKSRRRELDQARRRQNRPGHCTCAERRRMGVDALAKTIAWLRTASRPSRSPGSLGMLQCDRAALVQAC